MITNFFNKNSPKTQNRFRFFNAVILETNKFSTQDMVQCHVSNCKNRLKVNDFIYIHTFSF